MGPPRTRPTSRGRNSASLISVTRQEFLPQVPLSAPKAGAARDDNQPPPTSAPIPRTPPDDRSLAEFGYRQELHRSLGRYASFAAGFSFISVLTTVFQFFAFGYAFGGPVFFWAWPAVLVGQLLVAACFAELAARYPISGAIYQWSSRLSNLTFGWFAGWIMVIGQIVVVAAAALALQMVLPGDLVRLPAGRHRPGADLGGRRGQRGGPRRDPAGPDDRS